MAAIVSVIVLAVSRLDGFFQNLVSLGTRYREGAVRKHLAMRGDREATTCDLPALVKKTRRLVSFRKRAARLENIFGIIFGCSPWPTEDIRDTVLDLVLLRNLVVHASGEDWSEDGHVTAEYAPQFRCAEVLTVRRYGTYAVYSVDDYEALQFFQGAIQCVIQQMQYLEARLVQDSSWAERPD